MKNKRILLYFIILWQMCSSTASDKIEDKENDDRHEESALAEVRAVFINCEPVQEESVAPVDSDSTRFEREELFKHSVLRDCNKKLAVTVKITSEPNSSGDEYLPIEHVFEGVNRKRIRLLDPYILRLRREAPLQAYKLRKLETITGILLDSEGSTVSINYKHTKSHIERDKRQYENLAWTPELDDYPEQTQQSTPQGMSSLQPATLSVIQSASHQTRSCVENDIICTKAFNTTLHKRKKRSEHNIVVEDETNDNKQWNSKEQYYHIAEPERESVMQGDIYEERSVSDDVSHPPVIDNDIKETSDILLVTKPQIDKITNLEEKVRHKQFLRFRMNSKGNESKIGRKKTQEKLKTTLSSTKTKEHKTSEAVTNKGLDTKYAGSKYNNNNNAVHEQAERDYAVYEIGHPELWYTVHVQLFEKLNTPDGKTVWNDLTKGEQASVSSTAPEWKGQDLNVRYRPAEWIPREEFSLPSSSLCLLAPIRDADSSSYSDNSTDLNGVPEDGGYIILPEEDVMGLKEEDINKRNDNMTETEEIISKPEEHMEKIHRKVVVRPARDLLSGREEKVNIAYHGADKYLTLPHRRPHHAQIDLEARADENELVRVGASGRIAIAVADSTRRSRTIVTLQVGNTGLAAARFRVVTRDCGPELVELVNERNKQLTTAGPVLIPPRHTRTLRLELPVEIPLDTAHCSVALMNDEDKSIAVRDVVIKKGDRCFCVWHCDCVCLSNDPRLLCREMAEARQSAAGLSSRDRTRHARSACYEDSVSLNVFVVITGVLAVLFLLGCLKAILGLLFKCIGAWGLHYMVQIPRKIDKYYESCLKDRRVEYDCEGYPVHPDTRERTVRQVSKSMEFILNMIFFLSVPCIIVCNVFKALYSRFRSKSTDHCGMMTPNNNTKKCFSSQDMQGLALRWRRRRGGLRKWMTPQAQELSRELWKDGLMPSMRPLLREGRHAEACEPGPHLEPHEQDTCGDSEQDDTDYVLTQMQKSRESLSILKQRSKS